MPLTITKPITFGTINELRRLHDIDLLKILEPKGLDFFNDIEKTLHFIAFFTNATYDELINDETFNLTAMEEVSKEILLKLSDFFPPVQGEKLRHALQANDASMETLQKFFKVIDQLTSAIEEMKTEDELNDVLQMLMSTESTFSNAPELSASIPTQEPPKN